MVLIGAVFNLKEVVDGLALVQMWALFIGGRWLQFCTRISTKKIQLFQNQFYNLSLGFPTWNHLHELNKWLPDGFKGFTLFTWCAVHLAHNWL